MTSDRKSQKSATKPPRKPTQTDLPTQSASTSTTPKHKIPEISLISGSEREEKRRQENKEANDVIDSIKFKEMEMSGMRNRTITSLHSPGKREVNRLWAEYENAKKEKK
ncbi:hypothetical protein H4I96_10331 [Botrytis cinerea]